MKVLTIPSQYAQNQAPAHQSFPAAIASGSPGPARARPLETVPQPRTQNLPAQSRSPDFPHRAHTKPKIGIATTIPPDGRAATASHSNGPRADAGFPEQDFEARTCLGRNSDLDRPPASPFPEKTFFDEAQFRLPSPG